MLEMMAFWLSDERNVDINKYAQKVKKINRQIAIEEMQWHFRADQQHFSVQQSSIMSQEQYSTQQDSSLPPLIESCAPLGLLLLNFLDGLLLLLASSKMGEWSECEEE